MSDPYWSNVSLLLPMEGENGSTTFTDYSPSLKSVTRNGNPIISTARSKWGNGSGYLYDAALTAPSSIPATGDFTVEMWFSAAFFWSYDHVLVSQKGGTSANRFLFAVKNYPPDSYLLLGTDGVANTFDVSLTLDEWIHLAVSRYKNSFYVFKGGILLGTTTITSSIVEASTYIGGYGASSNLIRGYLQDVRITSGVARYTENFTPPGAFFYGLGSISGVVYSKNESGVYVPGSYPVYAYPRSTGVLVGSTMSDNEGNYTISPLLTDEEYYLVSRDGSLAENNTVIVDKVIPS